MAEPTNSLVAFSDAAAQLVERSASSIVAVHGGGRWPSSGIHLRSGVIVTKLLPLSAPRGAPGRLFCHSEKEGVALEWRIHPLRRRSISPAKNLRLADLPMPANVP